MRWVVYIVQCADQTLYTGCTNNIDKRIGQHNSGKGAVYTKHRRPVVVMKIFEVQNRSEALKLEYKIKQLSRSDKWKLIRGELNENF